MTVTTCFPPSRAIAAHPTVFVPVPWLTSHMITRYVSYCHMLCDTSQAPCVRVREL